MRHKLLALLMLLCVGYLAQGDTPPPGAVYIKGGTDNTLIGNVGNASNVNVNNTVSASISGNVPVTQSTSPWVSSISNFPSSFGVTQLTSPWIVSGNLGRTWTLNSNTDSVSFAGTVVATNPSVGANANTLPTSSTLVGAQLGANLQPLQLDASKYLYVDGSQVTQPVSGTVAVSNFPSTQAVSGTVTANAGSGNFTVVQPSGASLHTDVDNFPSSQNVVVTNSPTVAATQSGGWTTGRTWNLNSVSDSVMIGNSVLNVSQATNPWTIAGTVTANAGSGTFTVGQATGTNLHAVIDNFPSTFSVTQGTSPWLTSRNWTLSSGTDSINVSNFPSTQSVTQGTTPWVVSGAVTGSGNFTVVQPTGSNLHADIDNFPSSQNVVVTNTPTVNAAQSGTWNTGRTWNLNSGTDSVTIAGSVTASNASIGLTGSTVPASATFVGFKDHSGNLNSVNLTTAGALPVDGSGVTQPVSGTVTANQGTSPWIENVSQFGGNNVVTGTGTSGVGIPRVTVSNDSNILATQSGSWTTGRTWDLSSGTDSVSAAQMGTWTTGRTWDLNNSTDSVAAAQQGTCTTGRTWNLVNTSDSVNVGNFPATQAVTQSTSPWVVSGTVTANAGTGNFTVVQSSGSNLHVNIDSIPTTTVTGTITSNQGTSPWVDNISQFGGNNVVTGTGASGLGIPRVTVSNDSNILASQSGSWTVAQSGTWNVGLSSGSNNIGSITNITGTVSLPTGAATSANQTTQIGYENTTASNTTSILTNQTNNTQNLSSTAVPGSTAVAHSEQISGTDGTNSRIILTDNTGRILVGGITTATVGDLSTTGNITTTCSTPTTACPAGSFISFPINGVASARVQVAGTFSGASINVDGTVDGINWFVLETAANPTSLYTSSAITTTGEYRIFRISSATQLRVRASTLSSGSVALVLNASIGSNLTEVVQMTPSNLLTTSYLNDGSGNAISSTTGSLNVDVTNTVPVSQSGTWNVGLNAGSNNIGSLTNITGTISLPTGASSSSNQTNGSQKTQVVDGSGNVVGPVQTISGTNYAPVVLAASATLGTAAPTNGVQVGGTDGTNLRSIGVQSLTTNPPSGAYYLQVMPMTYNYKNLTGAATTTVKSGAGVLHEFCVNNNALSTTAVLYDNTAGSGTIIATLTETTGGGDLIAANCLLHDINFSTGLTVVTTGATANFTAIYK